MCDAGTHCSRRQLEHLGDLGVLSPHRSRSTTGPRKSTGSRRSAESMSSRPADSSGSPSTLGPTHPGPPPAPSRLPPGRPDRPVAGNSAHSSKLAACVLARRRSSSMEQFTAMRYTQLENWLR